MEALRLLPAQRPPLATAEAWGSGANQRLNTQAGRRPLDTEPRRSSRRGCSPSCQERGAGRSIREIRPELPRGRQPAIAQRATGTQTQRRQRRDPCVPGGKFRRVLSRASHRVSLRRNVTRAESTDNTAFRSSCILGSGRRSGTGPDISCQSNDSKEPASKSILPRGVEPLAALSCAAAASSLLLLLPPSASAALLELAPEPSNALSLPTWVIHVASVVEWVAAMVLVWEYGAAPERAAWRGLTWAMVPLLLGAMCACTWHFFYNSPDLEFLVVLQSFATLFGNCTLCFAAFRIFTSSKGTAS